jgi:MFS family permease
VPSARATPARVLLRWLSMVVAVCPEFAFVVWGAARLSDSGLDVAGATAAAVAFPIGMGMGRFLAPRFIDRVPVVTIGALVGIAGGLVVAAPVSPVLVALAMGLAGLGIAALYPVSLARLVSAPGLGLELGSALAAVASGTAIILSPILLDALAMRVGLRTGFLVVVPALLAVILLSRLTTPPQAPRLN